MAPNRAGRFVFLLIQTLPTFWAERIRILITCIFYFLDPTFMDFQVPRSPNFWISRSPDLQFPRSPNSQISRFPDFQTPAPAMPAPPPDKLSDPIRVNFCCDYGVVQGPLRYRNIWKVMTRALLVEAFAVACR